MERKSVTTAEAPMVAFLIAVANGDFARCKSLIEQGVSADARDHYGNSPLMLVASKRYGFFLAELLIKAGGASVDAANVLGKTALSNTSWTPLWVRLPLSVTKMPFGSCWLRVLQLMTTTGTAEQPS